MTRASDFNASSFWAWVVPAAHDIQSRYGIPWQVVAGQASLESGNGSSSVARSSNNLFGYHGQGPAGSVTCEAYHTACKAYNTVEESIDDYARLVGRHSYYAGAQQFRNDPWKFITTVWIAGYAEGRNYARDVGGRMRIADPSLPQASSALMEIWDRVNSTWNGREVLPGVAAGTSTPARAALVGQLASIPDIGGGSGGGLLASMGPAIPIAGAIGAGLLVAGGLWWYFRSRRKRK